MNALLYALAILATYRVAHLISSDYEEGPFSAFAWVRSRIPQTNWVGRGVRCILCVSFWLSMVPAALLPLPFVLGWLGIAGGVVVLSKVAR